MKIHIIYCHPSKKSYTFEILQHLLSNLEKVQLEFEVSDLYAMSFKSDMTESEYEREGFAKVDLPIPEDVRLEQKKINKADCLIFIYPVWWSDCPSKLKGWFDRIYSIGYAYGCTDESQAEKMKVLKYGLVICTAGHPNEFLQEIGIAESMRNVMLDDRLGKRFEKKEMIILGGTLNKEKIRQSHQNQIDTLTRKIIEFCS